TVKNSEEREYLDGLVAESIIGTRSISCVYIETLAEGKGLQVEVSNVDWCTKEMYINALVTAGITDAKLIVTSPVVVSGTAALTGVYKAYEDITGEKLDESAKLAGTQELVVTAELADEIGSYDAVAIVNELKLILGDTVNMTDEELREEIIKIAKDYNVNISDGQITQIIKLVRSLEGLDDDALKQRVEQAQEWIQTIAKAQTTVQQVAQSVKEFFVAVGDFLKNLFGSKSE
ncbi:MAG: DUF1002 domain-containing protein, partial [Clostridiales bacterium]|nr:DUF1002 domain-containing protein [Clostridiales bacterium]